MPSRSVWFALIVIVLLVICGNWIYQYWTQSKNLSPGLEARQEYNIALADVSSPAWTEPVTCVVGLTILAFLLSAFKVFRYSSMTRSLLAALLVALSVFAGYAIIMDNQLKQRDATYILSPSIIVNCFAWAALGTIGALAFWFFIERLYISRGIARDA